MRCLVFGRSGQVATELRRLCPAGWEMVALGRDRADLGAADCARALRDAAPDVAINAAAFTAVDAAEGEEARATAVNGAGPAALARVAAAMGIPFLHVSTDYVFDGSGSRPWRSDDVPAPINAYGRSKLSGEEGVRAAGGRHAILRTSWVFSAHGTNFVKTMLRLGPDRGRLRIVNDQIGGPTPADAIAACLLQLARALVERRAESGTWHFAGAPDVSWADFAREIFAQAGMAVEIEEIASTEYPTPARRPANSRLDCSTLERDFGIARPDWREGLSRVLQELGAR